jgi:hypothetical protein
MNTAVTTALTTPPALDTAALDLVLVRMRLPSKNPVTPSVVRTDVGRLLGSELPASELDDMPTGLASADYLTEGKRNTFTLTEAGRERALRFLGVGELPARTNWSLTRRSSESLSSSLGTRDSQAR